MLKIKNTPKSLAEISRKAYVIETKSYSDAIKNTAKKSFAAKPSAKFIYPKNGLYGLL